MYFLISSQTEMQEHFSTLFKEKSLSHIETYVKESESVANQFVMLTETVDRGDIVLAFEKVIC